MTRERAFWLQQRLQFSQQAVSKKGYSPGQLIFGRDMILLVKLWVYWELIRQQSVIIHQRVLCTKPGFHWLPWVFF